MLLVHQILNLGGHCCGFASAGTGNQKAIIIISDNRPPLLVIKANVGVNRVKDMVKIRTFSGNCSVYQRSVVRRSIRF